MVRAREPTEVPMALATSLAPTPQAMKKPEQAGEYEEGEAVVGDQGHGR